MSELGRWIVALLFVLFLAFPLGLLVWTLWQAAHGLRGGARGG